MKSEDIIKMQLNRLNDLQAYTKKPILVKAYEGKAQPDSNRRLFFWNYYKDVWSEITEPIYTRGILLNEICFDPDVKEWNTLSTELKKVQAYCRKEGIPLELGYTGGNGIHGHIFFDSFLVDVDNIEKCKSYEVDLFKIARNVLLDTILEGAGTNRIVFGLDSKKVNFGKDRKGSQIREFGTLRPDGHYKTLITEIPETREKAQAMPLIFPEKIVLWTVPDRLNKTLNENIKQEIKKSIEYNHFNTESVDLRGNKLVNFPCLKTLFKNGATSGSRYYGSNSIVLMAKKCGLSWTVTEDHIKKFFDKCGLTEAEAKLRIDNNKPMFESSDYSFSCKTVKEVFGEDICRFTECVMCDKTKKIRDTEPKTEEVPQHIKDAANKHLNDGTALEFLMTTCKKTHVGDETTIKATFGAITSQSVRNSSGIQPKVSGGSGKGKSHAIKTAMLCVPQDYIEETSLSGKALFHSNIRPGTIIFSDDEDPEEIIQNVIKRSTTNFQSVTKHKISVKDGNDWTTKTLMIPERIIWVLTSVNDTGSLEYLNRQFNLGVDESAEQDDKVWVLIAQKAVIGEMDFNISDDVLICREIVRDIKSHVFTVTIPYANRIVFNDKQNRRNGAQFMDFIRAFTVLNYRLRVKPGENIIEANEDDFKNALSLYGARAPNQKFKLNDSEMAILKKMDVGEPCTIEKLQEITKKSRSAIYFTFHGRNGKGGLLEKVPGLEYKPETEFLGTSEISGYGEYEKEHTVIKRTKPRHVYVLKTDFKNTLDTFGNIASLLEVKP